MESHGSNCWKLFKIFDVITLIIEYNFILILLTQFTDTNRRKTKQDNNLILWRYFLYILTNKIIWWKFEFVIYIHPEQPMICNGIEINLTILPLAILSHFLMYYPYLSHPIQILISFCPCLRSYSILLLNVENVLFPFCITPTCLIYHV